MTFRELWAKGASNKIFWLRAVQIERGKEVDDGGSFSGQRWKRQQEQICGNTTINNPEVSIAYRRKSRRLGR